jgi:hypothetical protein
MWKPLRSIITEQHKKLLKSPLWLQRENSIIIAKSRHPLLRQHSQGIDHSLSYVNVRVKQSSKKIIKNVQLCKINQIISVLKKH